MASVSTPYLSLKSGWADPSRSMAHFPKVTGAAAMPPRSRKGTPEPMADATASLLKLSPLIHSCTTAGCAALPEKSHLCGLHCAAHCCANHAHGASLMARRGPFASKPAATCMHGSGCDARVADGCPMYCRTHCCKKASDRNRADAAKRVESQRRRERREAARRERGL